MNLPDSTMEPDITTYESIYKSQEPFGTVFTYDIGAGRNPENEPCLIVSYHVTPFVLVNPAEGQYETIVGDASVSVSYTLGSLSLDDDEEGPYDLLVLSPSGFLADLQPLIAHKEDMGFDTKLVSLDEIYAETYFELTEQEREDYNRDEQETIKYFIYQAVENWDVDYVLAVGGWRSFWGLNRPNIQFPIRYSRYDDGSEPGYACDQYYSFFKDFDNDTQEYFFDDWDTNGNDIIAEGIDTYDAHADVVFGRLACRNRLEVRTMVNKIITYETSAYDEDWFKKFLTITGDGFQDIVVSGGSDGWNKNYWNFDTTLYPAGEYTICAQSIVVNQQQQEIGELGPVDEVHITVDPSAPSRITFHETDHLLTTPLDEEQESLYPAQPIGTIVVPSDGDILGNTDVSYNPPEAYISDTSGWALISYQDGLLKVKVKAYDPSPKDDIDPPEDFGSYVKTWIWANNSEGVTMAKSKTYILMYYEGEMECQQAHDYMDEAAISFDDEKLWASNGKWTGMHDVIDEISEGYGFVYFAGHGNPMSWGDHLPGIPGGRDDGMINGLKCFNMDFGLARYETEEGDPMFPMDHLTNGDKQPIILVGGCHNSFIDASFMKLVADPDTVLFSVLHGAWVPECFDWWLIRMPQGGGMASIGCSGLGYGYLGKYCLTGYGGWINPEFFRVYANGTDILGETFTQTITNYANVHGAAGTNRKTIEEWVFLGDPTLKIGGYEPDTGSLEVNENISFGDIEVVGSQLVTEITNINDKDLTYFDWEMRVTGANPLGRYFGLTGTIFASIFQGRVWSGGYNTEYVVRLKPDETMEISTQPLFGLGHIHINVSVYDNEGELIGYRENPFTEEEEDGFLLGSRIILTHPEE